jgi:peptidoglycan/xylan/chitin deacetylase (PgdA/CDA1 family)
VTFSEATSGGQSGKVVAVTFDDGFRSVIELARPILDRFGMPATVFIPTAFIPAGRPLAWQGTDQWLSGQHEGELAPLSGEQIGSLLEAGWEIGSHTRTHPHLPALSDEELRAELRESRRECGELIGRECRSIAFPYGDFDDRVLRETAAAGYSAAATLPGRFAQPAPIAHPRVGVYHADSSRSFRLKVSPTVRRLRSSPAWGPLARLAHSIKRR